jgi:hypothetical protein
MFNCVRLGLRDPDCCPRGLYDVPRDGHCCGGPLVDDYPYPDPCRDSFRLCALLPCPCDPCSRVRRRGCPCGAAASCCPPPPVSSRSARNRRRSTSNACTSA